MATHFLKTIQPLLIGAVFGLSLIIGSEAQATVNFSSPGYYCNAYGCYHYRNLWRCNHGFCTAQTIYYPHYNYWYRHY